MFQRNSGGQQPRSLIDPCPAPFRTARPPVGFARYHRTTSHGTGGRLGSESVDGFGKLPVRRCLWPAVVQILRPRHAHLETSPAYDRRQAKTT